MNWDDEENVNAAANEPQTNVFEAPADLTPTTPPAAPADFTPTTPPTAPTAATPSSTKGFFIPRFVAVAVLIVALATPTSRSPVPNHVPDGWQLGLPQLHDQPAFLFRSHVDAEAEEGERGGGQGRNQGRPRPRRHHVDVHDAGFHRNGHGHDPHFEWSRLDQQPRHRGRDVYQRS